MLTILVMTILVGLAGLVVGERVDAARRGSSRLHDRYHE